MSLDADTELSTIHARVRKVIGRLLADHTARASSDGSIHELFPVAIPEAEGIALRDWVVKEKATRSLEIGLGYGLSALFVVDGLLTTGGLAARHIVIDPFQDSRFAGLGRQVLDEAGVLDLVEHHAERSQFALPRFVAEGQMFDLAFVDGNHRFDAVFVDLFYLGSLVRKGGIIMLDDYQLPGVAKAASFFIANVGWVLEDVSEADPLHQWAILRTPQGSDERPFDFFVNF